MLTHTPILPGITVINLHAFEDERGYFMESYNARSFHKTCGTDEHFVQDNYSHSKRNTLRGLHYQIKQPQGKLIRLISGIIFDVIVDLRKSSPTYAQWMSFTLDAKDKQAIWIPRGFAHGFLVLSAEADFSYKTTDYYCPEGERCLRWDDPALGVPWPIKGPPLISPKDLQGKPLSEADCFP